MVDELAVARAHHTARQRIGAAWLGLQLEAVASGGERASLVSRLPGGGEVKVPRHELEEFLRALNGEDEETATISAQCSTAPTDSPGG